MYLLIVFAYYFKIFVHFKNNRYLCKYCSLTYWYKKAQNICEKWDFCKCLILSVLAGIPQKGNSNNFRKYKNCYIYLGDLRKMSKFAPIKRAKNRGVFRKSPIWRIKKNHLRNFTNGFPAGYQRISNQHLQKVRDLILKTIGICEKKQEVQHKLLKVWRLAKTKRNCKFSKYR